MSKVKSPLRYPGGKYRVADKLLSNIPTDIKEYREPFLGGASVFLSVKQSDKHKVHRYWLNDLYYNLYCFWSVLQIFPTTLISSIKEIKENRKDGRSLYTDMTTCRIDESQIATAIKFFVLNRITFSGISESGGYSQQAFDKRFTDSSIDRLGKLDDLLLYNTMITNHDYSYLLEADGDDVFLFMDPPYLTATKSKLYGKNGDHHTGFDHIRLAQAAKDCKHRWLITYDDCEEIRNLYSFANITKHTLQYSMTAAKGNELIITNY